MMEKKKITILTLSIIFAVFLAIVAFYSMQGQVKIVTDFPEIHYSLNGEKIDANFVLREGRYEATVPTRPGLKIFKASTASGEIIKEKEILIRNRETVEVVIEVARGELRDYMLEGE